MGYDLRITRAEGHWADNKGREITREEWQSLVNDDPVLRLEMEWRRGNIASKNPTGQVVAKMLRVAGMLGARVQGDDGETYLPDGRVKLADGLISHEQDWRAW
jgi:hypothetical protein